MNATLSNIKSDLIARVEILRALREDFDPDQCARLAYYDQTHFMRTHPREARIKLRRFVETMRELLETGTEPESAQRLRGQLRFLFLVYSGGRLTYADREQGSSFHRRVNSRFTSLPRYLNDQISGWVELCREMQAELDDFDPQVIENIMIDESLELLGREMSR